jgi:thiamine transport system permease protein
VLQLLVVTILLVAAARARRTPDATVARARARLRRPGPGDLPAILATGVLVVLVVVPLASLVVSSLRVDGGWSLANYRALQTPGSHQALLVPVTDAVVNSLRIAVDATWMSLLLGLTVAAVVTRRSRTIPERRLRSGLDGVFMLPLGVSAVTLGFGFLITLGRPPLDLRDSPLLIPVAQALVALPLVVRVLVPVLSGVDDRLRQAAATLGASPVRALLVVDLPVVFRPLLAAAGFAFACSLGEFGATSFLVRDDRPTLPVVIFRLIGHPGDLNYGMALAGSVVLGATTAAVLLLVERLRVPSVGSF